MATEKKLYTVSVYTENNIGLLNRISAIFQRRHINIESLNISVSEIKGVSRFTILIHMSEDQIKKVLGQIEKQVEVIKAYYHTDDDTIYQESCLFKIKSDLLFEERQIQNIIKESNAHIVTVNKEFFVLEKSGRRAELETLHKALSVFGIMQFVRSGRISVSKEKMEITSLLEELQSVKLSIGQQEEYEQRFESLQYAEDIKIGFAKGFQALEDEHAGILSQIRILKQAIQGISKFSDAYQALFDRVESSWIELEDISQEIQRLSVSIEDDPKQLENLQSKLQAIYSLQKKHHVASINELLEVQNDLEQRCFQTENAEAAIQALTDKIAIAFEKLKALAKTLHQNRTKVAPALSKELEAILSHLGIKSASFDFKISQTRTKKIQHTFKWW